MKKKLGLMFVGCVIMAAVFSLPVIQILIGLENGNLESIVREEPHADWKDGIYTGKAFNQRGEPVLLEVMVEAGQLHHIRVMDNQDSSLVAAKVARIITKRMLKKNSSAVDGVSGATISSGGILAAVNNALDQAKR